MHVAEGETVKKSLLA